MTEVGENVFANLAENNSDTKRVGLWGKLFVGKKEQTGEKMIRTGFRIGDKLYVLTEQSPLNSLLCLAHEIGHALGDKLSYGKEVLSPDEVNRRLMVFTPEEAGKIYKLLVSKNQVGQNTALIDDIVFSMVKIFTKGKAKIEDLTINRVDTATLDAVVKKFLEQPGANISSGDIVNGVLVRTSTRKGRNAEISAYVIEVACTRLLENGMRLHFPDFAVRGGKYEGSYARARAIVNRAYTHKGWRLPSMRDIRQDVIKEEKAADTSARE